MKGLRHSWLSREVLGLSAFAGVASAFAGMLLLDLPGRSWVGLATVLAGIAGVLCSARIYVVKARPAWCSRYTVAEFFATALLLGALFVRMMGVSHAPWVAWVAAGGGGIQLGTQALKFLWLSRSENFELRASSLLLSGRFRSLFLARMGVLLAAGIVAPAAMQSELGSAAAFALALSGEWLGRWLFFVTVVPKNMAAAFSGSAKVAA